MDGKESGKISENPSVAVRSSTEEIIYPYVNRLIRQAETILDLDPSYNEAFLFQILTKNIVHFLEAEIASIWLFENTWQHLASFFLQESLLGYCNYQELFDLSIAQQIVRMREPILIPNIEKEDRWQKKESLRGVGINSVLLVPIFPPRFSIRESDPGGVLQVFYRETNKAFSPLEIEVAELFSRRVSYVLARKKIKDLQKCNSIKDRIVEHIFERLAKGEGIVMRNLFISVIPELTGIMDIQRSALFSVNRQKREVVLEAGYPEKAHGIGKTRSIEEPFIQRIIEQKGPFGDFEHERVYPHYILITDPQKSQLIPGDIRYFLETQNIHSVLYLPLKKAEEVNYFLAFDAQGQHKGFTDEEIELFLFLGMELIKGLRLERLHDLLHDSKNIGISLAYFTKRIQNILRKEKYPENEKLNQAMEIILEESNRLQGLFLALFAEGEEETVDLTEIVRRRFLFYRETMKEMKRDNIHFIQNELATSLRVRCIPSDIERIVNNLLSNAISAVPDEGGELSVRTYQEDSWAVMEIANTGRVSKEELEQYLRGEEDGRKKRKGRGLHICNELVRNMGGEIGVEVKDGFVIFRILFPMKQMGCSWRKE